MDSFFQDFGLEHLLVLFMLAISVLLLALTFERLATFAWVRLSLGKGRGVIEAARTADLAAARATAERSTDREAMNGDAAEVPSFAPSEEGVGEAVTAWGHDPDVVGEACTPPVDVACVVVRAFAPFRHRLPTSARRPTAATARRRP